MASIGPRPINILLSLLAAVQITAAAALVWPKALVLDKQLGLYAFFVAAAFGMNLALGPFLERGWRRVPSRKRIAFFVCVETLLTFFLLSAAFKLVVYDRFPQLAQRAYGILLALLLLHKIFYKPVFAFWEGLKGFVSRPANQPVLSQAAYYGFFPALIFLLYLPDAQGVVARVFAAEQFHNWDGCVFGPAFAYDHGSRLYVDTTSRYGLGMPIVAAYLMKWMGGLSHVHLLQMLMWLAIVYYGAWFVLMRQWLGGVLLPAATILFAVRTQMFHTGAYPLTFTYPSGTPLRFFMDIVVFFLLWRFLKTGWKALLWAAAACCGFMIFYMFAEGLYLTAAFYAFLILYALRTHRLPGSLWVTLAGIALAVPLAYFAFMFLAEGRDLFTPQLWANMAEYRNDFLAGIGIAPMTGSLAGGNYLQSLMSFVLPLVYMATLLAAGGSWVLGLAPEKYLLAAVIAVQGLGLYHYYTLLSIWTGYYMLGVPFNILVGFWVHEALGRWPAPKRRAAAFGLAAVSLWALVTNHNFISYPNLMNFSRNPLIDPAVVQPPPGRAWYFNHLFREYPDWAKLPLNSLGERNEDLKTEADFFSDQDLTNYYLRETNYAKDAALIQKYIGPQVPVPLLSAFETEFLQQAGRKPFFYYFPVLNSRPLRMRIFHVVNLSTFAQVDRTIEQLKTQRPQYVFMERIYLNDKIPQSYFNDTPGLVAIVAYIQQNYQAVEAGEYLECLKIRS